MNYYNRLYWVIESVFSDFIGKTFAESSLLSRNRALRAQIFATRKAVVKD